MATASEAAPRRPGLLDAVLAVLLAPAERELAETFGEARMKVVP